jgi:hypothetical protein
MRRGTPLHAAGRPNPGTSPHSASPHSYAALKPNHRRLWWHRHVLPVSGFTSSSSTPSPISNRHTMQLEITATHPESTTSLFLIVPKHAPCTRKTACCAGCHPPIFGPATTTKHPQPTHTIAISNRHLMQLKITTTRPKSATSLFLIDPNSTHFAQADHSPRTNFPLREGLKNPQTFRRISGSGKHPARFCAGERPPRLGGRTIGSTADSGSAYPGSSPGLPANFFSAVNPENAQVLKAALALNSAPSHASALPYTRESAL